MLSGFTADKAHICRIAITECSVSVVASAIAAACNGVSMLYTANPRVDADGLEVFVPTPDCLASWIDDLVSFPIICNPGLDPVSVSIAFYRVMRSIGPELTSKIWTFCIAGVQER